MNSLYSESVVLVLGDRDILQVIGHRIRNYGYDLIQAQSLDIASGKLQRNRAELIILDSLYPEFSMEGFLKFHMDNPGAGDTPLLLLAEPGSPSVPSGIALNHHIQVIERSNLKEILNRIDHHLRPSHDLKFWGVRGSTPTPGISTIRYGGNTTCVQVSSPHFDDLVVLDSGTGIRYLGNEIEHRLANRVDGHIFITHSHWDHIQGLPFFKPFYNSGNRFRIHMPEQFRGGTREVLSGHMASAFFPVSVDTFTADIDYMTQREEAADYAGFRVEYMIANHPAKTAIYKIHAGDSVIVFAPDNELNLEPSPIRFIDEFEEFISGCDLLIHDAQYNLKNYRYFIGRGHSAWETVVEVARRNNVRRLYLTHHDPDSTDSVLEETEKKLQVYRGNPFLEIGFAKEGSVVKLPLYKK